jgi:hypothetical protein
MSLENSFERIASALEKIADHMANPMLEVPPMTGPGGVAEAPEKPKRAKKEKVVVETVEAAPLMPAPLPVQDVVPAVVNQSIPSPDNYVEPPQAVAAELRALAQIIAAKAGPGLGEFTQYVRTRVCPQYNVEKLIDIPAEKVTEARNLIINWATSKGIKV